MGVHSEIISITCYIAEIQPILHHNSDFDKSSPDSEVYQAEQIEGSRNVGRGLLEYASLYFINE